jgi:hypothetical protein
MKFGAYVGKRGMAVEQPLGRIIGMWFRKPFRILFGSNGLPPSEVERYFDKGCVRDFECAINFADRFIELG